MTELEPGISIKPTGLEKIEESEPITDEEIAKANELFKRKESKENPLADDEKILLEKLTEKRKEELNRIFPEFSYEVIYGLKGTSEESGKQFEAAKKYFESIMKMVKPDEKKKEKESGSIKKFVLRLEKLRNWNISPERVEIIFADKFDRKRVEYMGLIKRVKAERCVKFPETDEDWEAFLEKANSRESISNGEMERFGKAIEKQKLALKAYIPQYRREAAIYLPREAEGWRRELIIIYKDSGKLRSLRGSIQPRIERIEQFEEVKKRRMMTGI